MKSEGRATIALLLLALMVVSAFSFDATPARAAGSTLVIGEVGKPSPTFLQSFSDSNAVGTTDAQFPYLWLYPLGINGVLNPIGVANLPQVVAGTNGTQWIVNLRSADMKWSDGVPINATDLAYSLGIFLPHGQFANISTVDIWGAIRTTVSNITVMNTTAIKVTTIKPDPLFGILTNLYAVYPWHYYKQFTGVNALANMTITGGPGDSAYVPQNYDPNSRTINLVANPNSISWGGKTPTIQNVAVQLFVDDNTLVNALAAGTIDAASISASDVAALQPVSGVKIDQTPSARQMMLWLRTTGYPFNDTSFRQAIMTLMPKQQVNSQLYGGTAALGNPLWMLPQGISTYWPGSSTPTYNYSTSQATTLLKQAGLTQDSSGNWLLKNGTRLNLAIEVDNSDPNEVRAAQFFQSSLQSAGIQTSLNAVPTTTASVDEQKVTYQVLVWNNAVSPTPYRWMRNSLNYPNYQNATFSGLLQKALADTNSTTSLQELKTAELAFASAAVVNSFVVLPSYVAYSTKSFANWEPAVINSVTANALGYPLFSEQVLTSVQPLSAGTSTSNASNTTTVTTTSSSNSSTATTTTTIATTTSSINSSSTSISTTSTTTTVPATTSTTSSSSAATSTLSTSSSTSSSSGGGTNYALLAGVAIAVIIIIGVAAYALRRGRR